MLKFVLKKMFKNKWLVCCLLIGSVLATSIISSIPMFSDGILQKVLIQDLNKQKDETGIYPGVLSVTTRSAVTPQNDLTIAQKYENYNTYLSQEMVGELGMEPVTSSTRLTMSTLDMVRSELVLTQEEYEAALAKQEEEKAAAEEKGQTYRGKKVKMYDEGDSKTVGLMSMSGLEEHIDIVSGRMYDPNSTEVIELIMTEVGAARSGMVLDKEYVFFEYYGNYAEPIRCKLVGLFTTKTASDPYWFDGFSAFDGAAVIPYDTMVSKFLGSGTSVVTSISWNTSIDYTQIPMSMVESFLYDMQMLQTRYGNYFDITYNSMDTLESYVQRREAMSSTLMSLQAPIILMLVFYIFMVSQLIIDHEKNEIAVLKSRGSSNGQVFMTYFLESLVLGAIAWIVGPFIGYGICKVLGLSDGFLELVNRASLPVSITSTAFLYSLLAVAIFILTMMIPVMLTTRMTIVKLKQSKARRVKAPVWKRFFLDFIFIAISLYQVYSSRISGGQNLQALLKQAGVEQTSAPVDPLSYISSTLFILGVGMLFLRIYPLFIKLIFQIGRRFWSPTLYASLTNISRSQGQNFFLMLFLILTVSIGVLNANTARTLNVNIEERISYNVGADMVVEQTWNDDTGTVANRETTSTIQVNGIYTPVVNKPDYTNISFVEPPNLFEDIPGIAQTSKVYNREEAKATGNSKTVNKVQVMGVEPYSFGQVAWFRSDLLQHHINAYLNLLADDARACLISQAMASELNVQVGDYVELTWDGQRPMECIVFGVVDFWPTVDPYASPQFAVCNLSYIQRNMKLEPYELWMKRDPGVTSEQIYSTIREQKIGYVNLEDANQMIIESKNDPLVTGTNGSLTLGFVITMAVSAIGFLIYWILNVKSRVLQFGILRSMGMTRFNLISMLFWEQVFMSVVAILFGFFLGDLTSAVFVPLLQQVGVNDLLVPPFKVVWEQADYLKIYAVTFIMMLADLAVLSTIVSKIKMSQALKLGED